MRKVNGAFAKVCSLAEGVKKMTAKCKHADIEWHVMIVEPGAPDQRMHVDDGTSLGNRCYYTLLVPLTNHANSGGTYIHFMSQTFSTFGAVLLFVGSVEHFGTANNSNFNRLFLYAAIFTSADNN